MSHVSQWSIVNLNVVHTQLSQDKYVIKQKNLRKTANN